MAGIRIKIMGTDELKEHMGNPDVVLIDARDAKEYEKMHIPGAISIPLDDIDKQSEKLDKDKEVIVYCNGVTCEASTEAAIKLAQKGFKNIWDYKGGMQDWRSSGSPTE